MGTQKDRPLTAQFIVLLTRGTVVAKMRVVTDLCCLPVKVWPFNIPKGRRIANFVSALGTRKETRL
jgi:hypothetical protein